MDKRLARDGLFWLVLMAGLAVLSFFMLARDAHKQYGALAFGGFPAFRAVDSRGTGFDEHRLHGHLSAVVVSDGPLSPEISLYLHKLSRATSRGKKYLTSLVLVDKTGGISDQWVEYLVLDEKGFQEIRRWKEGLFKDGVILVDQNAVVRGVFNLDDKLERMNFEGAVRGIL